MAKQLERQKVADEVLAGLRSDILGGKYPPGTKLPPERDLAKTLGVNRASVREALKKLEHLGLVTIRQGDGTRVTDFMTTAGIELITHLIPVAPKDFPGIVPDILEFRRIFGREVARLAATRADPDAVTRLESIAGGAADEELSLEQVFDLDFEFYVAMAAAGGNKVMGLLVNTVRGAVESYRPLLAQLIVSPKVVRDHHRALIEAIRAHDADKAAAVADQYLAAGTTHALDLI